MPAINDYIKQAQELPLDEFLGRHGHLFLVGVNVIEPPGGPHRTFVLDEQTMTGRIRELSQPEGRRRPVVLALRKAQETFESMITVGRTANNDIVLADGMISKFHAFFRQDGERLDLADAGSRNGTWVGAQRLVSKGPAGPVRLLEVVRFAHMHFRVLDARGCWEYVQAAHRT